MAAVAERRDTIINIINEVRRKLGLAPVTTLDSDTHSLTMLAYLNDVIAITSDYGDWQEALREVSVTASSSVRTYTISTSAPLKNIHEIAFEDETQRMWLRTFDQIRRWRRTTSGTGIPRNWAYSGS